MTDKIKELKDLLFELDSKHSVSVPDTQQNINDVAQKIVKLFAIPVVSVSFIEQIKKQIEYHKEQEATRASVKDYGQAIYHNNRRGALEDFLVWIKLNER